MKKHKYEIAIFIIEALCMTLELVASRILSPYFGNTNIVWTSVIGIILLSSSLGNYIGGRIADKNNCEKKLKINLMLSAVFILIIPIIQKYFLDFISYLINNVKIGAIISTVFLFFVPSTLLGTVIPIILKLKLNTLEEAGKTTGRIYAISTLGGLFGTFLSGFVLIPNLGCVEILFIISILLTLISLFIYIKLDKIIICFTILLILLNTVLFVFYFNKNNSFGDEILNGQKDATISIDTQYGRALIYNTSFNNKNTRFLKMDNGYESATYTDKGLEYELVAKYTKDYDLMFQSANEINNVLMIGGAGYSYPKYYISHYKDKKMDVVEIDSKITEIAKKYFYLDKLIEEYDINNNHRLNLIHEDGRTYLNNNKIKYDAILNDAFSGEKPAQTLTTIENISNIKNSLNDNGLYLTNILSSLEGEKALFLREEVNTLKQIFKNVYVIPCNKYYNKKETQNVIVISTDQSIKFENTYNLSIDKDELILTDNYCPIDNLV